MGGDGRLAYRDHVSSDSGAGSGSWWCRHQTAIDVAMAGGFVVLDTSVTLAGNSWWPAHPGPLAWAMLIAQAAACASLAARRRAPLAVVAILAAFTVAISLLIWPAGALVPAHPATVWAPYATVVAGYGPFFYQPNRRAALAAIAVLTLVVARPWQPSATVITAGVSAPPPARWWPCTSTPGAGWWRPCASGPSEPSRSSTSGPSRPGPRNAPGWPARCTTWSPTGSA
jgi:hypothetical protein